MMRQMDRVQCSVLTIFMFLTLDMLVKIECHEVVFPVSFWSSQGKMELYLRTTWLWVCPHLPVVNQNDQECQPNKMEIRFDSRIKHQMYNVFNELLWAHWVMEPLSIMKRDSDSNTLNALWELEDTDWVFWWDCCFPVCQNQPFRLDLICLPPDWRSWPHVRFEPWCASSSVLVALMQKTLRWHLTFRWIWWTVSDECYMTDVSSCQTDKGRVSKHAVF